MLVCVLLLGSVALQQGIVSYLLGKRIAGMGMKLIRSKKYPQDSVDGFLEDFKKVLRLLWVQMISSNY